MRTRAILQTSPFKTMRVKLLTDPYRSIGTVLWCAPAEATWSDEPIMVFFSTKPPSDLKGDTIIVERHGSEWRAV